MIANGKNWYGPFPDQQDVLLKTPMTVIVFHRATDLEVGPVKGVISINLSFIANTCKIASQRPQSLPLTALDSAP